MGTERYYWNQKRVLGLEYTLKMLMESIVRKMKRNWIGRMGRFPLHA